MRTSLRFIVALFVLGLVGTACAPAEEPQATDRGLQLAFYEIWAVDQGTGIVHIYDEGLEAIDEIDLSGVVELPHMIDFTSDHSHAFVAAPASGHTVWIRTEDREVLHVIETGPGSHMAAVVPGDEAVITASIGDGTLVEILLDLEAETFEMGRTLEVATDPFVAEQGDAFPAANPVCHAFTGDGAFAYVTLGPALDEGGLVVVDMETFEAVAAYPPDEVQTNCGAILGPNGMYVNGGSVTEGVWYMFATATHEVVHEDQSRGSDAHGVWLTPDRRELWMVNRATSNAIIIDTETNEVVDEIDFVGRSPDILAASPDGERMFVTLRGPDPRTGPHAIAGDSPGFAVIDIDTREVVTTIRPAGDDETSDFHGIGVRPL